MPTLHPGDRGGAAGTLPLMPASPDLEEPGDHEVPADLLELYEVLEWQAAVEGAP